MPNPWASSIFISGNSQLTAREDCLLHFFFPFFQRQCCEMSRSSGLNPPAGIMGKHLHMWLFFRQDLAVLPRGSSSRSSCLSLPMPLRLQVHATRLNLSGGTVIESRPPIWSEPTEHSVLAECTSSVGLLSFPRSLLL